MLAGASPDRTRFGGPVGRAAQDTRGRRSHALGVAPHRGQKGQGARPAQPDCSGLHDPGDIAAQSWRHRCPILATSLPKNGYSARAVLAVYRLRWQIELAFKRLKSLLHIDRLPTWTERGSRSWLYAHLILALLGDDLSQDFLGSSP